MRKRDFISMLVKETAKNIVRGEDNRSGYLGRFPYLWKMKEEHEEVVIKRLEEIYGGTAGDSGFVPGFFRRLLGDFLGFWLCFRCGFLCGGLLGPRHFCSRLREYLRQYAL